jgi:hypothetical protein
LTIGLLTFAQSDDVPANLTILVSTIASGLYTLAFYFTRRWWLLRLSSHPLRNAILLGWFNAAAVETIFWAIEKVFGAHGVAAHPNLLFDLILTMPWYIGMVYLFVGAQNRQRFMLPTLLFLAGLYEFGADGMVGGVIIPIIIGESTAFFTNPIGRAVLTILAFGYFILVYSSLLLPSAWLIAETPRPEPPYPSAWRDALKPLLWLIPFTVYLIGALFALFSMNFV